MSWLPGELLLRLRYFRNSVTPVISAAIGELLPGLPYLRNEWNAPRLSVKVNYYLDYGASETAKSKWIEDHYGELPLDLRCLRN